MNYKLFFLYSVFIFGLNIPTKIQSQSIRNCGTVSHLEYQKKNIPGLADKIIQQEINISKGVKSYKSQHKGAQVTYIPVVFHVIYSSSINNISDAQIQSQLDILNQDFRRMNSDTAITPADFKPIAADVEVEFCFAHQDPDGNWTDGVTRTQTSKSVFEMNTDDAKFTSQGGHDAWDATKYLNIWIVPMISDNGSFGILGYTQWPGGNWSTDGVVIGYNYIGNIGAAAAPFDLGRTATHEIGHWLGLSHIWGDDNGACWGSDDIDDTPNQAAYNFYCPSHPSISCSNEGDMFMNYMDYTDDSCMNIFTQGQKARIKTVIDSIRYEIKTSGKCQANAIHDFHNSLYFDVFPNPSESSVNVKWKSQEISDEIEILIIDITGKIVLNIMEKGNKNSTKININELNPGLYLIKIKSNLLQSSKTIIIQ